MTIPQETYTITTDRNRYMSAMALEELVVSLVYLANATDYKSAVEHLDSIIHFATWHKSDIENDAPQEDVGRCYKDMSGYAEYIGEIV